MWGTWEKEFSEEPGVLNFDIWRMVPNQGSLGREAVIAGTYKWTECSNASFHSTGGTLLQPGKGGRWEMGQHRER